MKDPSNSKRIRDNDLKLENDSDDSDSLSEDKNIYISHNSKRICK